jgi:AraC-like DNA-binding protein
LDALSQSVRAQISAKGFADLDFGDMARTLGVSERTLQRRLAEARTSFRQIIEDARMEEALHLLTRSGSSLPDIADRLAYSNPSSLSRAVRKRFGLSPAALRAAGVDDWDARL